jgi:hypothetical protein
MNITIPVSIRSKRRAALVLVALLAAGFLVRPGSVRAQKNAPPVAQVGAGSPLPVYVVNEAVPSLPDGFVPGTSWKFASWTVPSSLTFTVSVQKTEGGWALLTLATDPQSAPKWYYVPQMPGAWEQQ